MCVLSLPMWPPLHHRGARLRRNVLAGLCAPRHGSETARGREGRTGEEPASERKKKDKSAVMCALPLSLGLGEGKIFSCKEEEDRSAQVKSGGGGEKGRGLGRARYSATWISKRVFLRLPWKIYVFRTLIRLKRIASI